MKKMRVSLITAIPTSGHSTLMHAGSTEHYLILYGKTHLMNRSWDRGPTGPSLDIDTTYLKRKVKENE